MNAVISVLAWLDSVPGWAFALAGLAIAAALPWRGTWRRR